MPNIIACRVASYGKFQDRAWSHLPEIGVTNVEVPVPEPGQQDELRKRLADHGLTATSFQAKCDITQDDAVDVMQPQIAACAAFAVRICFVSIKAGDTDRSIVWDRLRAIGDVARDLGVVVVMETHPDLITNGQVAAETMAAINHPNVKVNYDTANVHFYNENVSSTDELAKIIDHVAAVHLKDTNGQYKTWHFPVLGAGVVDFPQIFKMLADKGFKGPCTMELEGIEGVEMNEVERLKYIADSVDYLRRIGVI
jgi:sugar phosphate isomerase/epimerase